MRRDIITRIETTLTSDRAGGYTEETEETVETGSFDVKLSVSNNEAEATAYGVSIEQVLKVVAGVPLMEAVSPDQEQETTMKTIKKIYFLYNGKKYELRAQIPYRSLYLVTLVEVTE